jgi:ribosome-associated protein
MDEDISLRGGVKIPSAELEWRFSAAGGPGGQHANTSNTRVVVSFDIAASPSLPDHVRARLLARLGPVVSVVSADQRSQWQNRRMALIRLTERLNEANVVPRRRVDTRPSFGAKQRRLSEKRQRSQTKTLRSRPDADA